MRIVNILIIMIFTIFLIIIIIIIIFYFIIIYLKDNNKDKDNELENIIINNLVKENGQTIYNSTKIKNDDLIIKKTNIDENIIETISITYNANKDMALEIYNLPITKLTEINDNKESKEFTMIPIFIKKNNSLTYNYKLKNSFIFTDSILKNLKNNFKIAVQYFDSFDLLEFNKLLIINNKLKLNENIGYFLPNINKFINKQEEIDNLQKSDKIFIAIKPSLIINKDDYFNYKIDKFILPESMIFRNTTFLLINNQKVDYNKIYNTNDEIILYCSKNNKSFIIPLFIYGLKTKIIIKKINYE